MTTKDEVQIFNDIFDFFKVEKGLTLSKDIYLYIKKKRNQCVYISRNDLDWIFPDKSSLKIGASFNLTPKINDDLRNFLEPSTGLINKESSQEEFDSVLTKGHFFLEKKRYHRSHSKIK